MGVEQHDPDFSPIEMHIRRAHALRVAYLSRAIATAIVSSWHVMKRFAAAVSHSPAHPGRAAHGASFLGRFAAHR
jgi:hypothetical protein